MFFTGTPAQHAVVIILGKNNTRFEFAVPPVLPSNQTTVNILLTNENVKLAAGGRAISREEFLLGLSGVTMIFLPATLYDRGATVKYGLLSAFLKIINHNLFNQN